MSARKKPDETRPVWRQCLECGNRYQSASHGYLVNWCSMSCEHAALRRQRDAIQGSWMRATWFVR